MLGYLGSKNFIETQFWSYVSVTIFKEVGCEIETLKAKIFNKDLFEVVRAINEGDQIEFEVNYVTRKMRKYINVTMIAPTLFETCNVCFRPKEICTGCLDRKAERLDGEFCILSFERQDYGLKLIMEQGGLLITYLLWSSLPFYEKASKLKAGDYVRIKGWRDNERITRLRTFDYNRSSPINV